MPRPPLQLVSESATEAGGSLFRQYSGYVASIALRLLGRDHEVEDVVQDVFLAALSGVAGVREKGAIRGWLATVTVRVVARRLRVRRLRSFLGLDEAPDYALIAHSATAEQKVIVAEVYRVLDGLRVRDRLAWTLRHAEDLPLDQVALLCNCSLATVKRSIAVAESAIAKALDD